jgi:ribosome maturation factor RimP
LTDRFAASDIADRAEQALAVVIAEAGFELVLCNWTGSARRPALQVYIERADGEATGISDCVEVHHAVTDFLDVEDFIPVSYDLEISSPGVERPLKRAEHFAIQIGKLVRVRTWESLAGRRNWTGLLTAVDDDLITVVVDGAEHRIPIPAIERAHLIYEPPPKGQKKGGTRAKRNPHH